MTIFSILFILYITAVCKTTAVATENHFQLEPFKFDEDRKWIVDSINTNAHHQFYNIFYITNISYCLIIEIHNIRSGNPQWFHIDLNFQSTENLFITYHGQVNGKFFNGRLALYDETDWECDKRLKFIYTDYINVVVLFGDDSYSGPHIMVLRSNDTNMTYEQRMSLIEPKIAPFFDFKNLKKVERIDCEKIDHWESKDTSLRKCWEFHLNKKRKIISDIIGYFLLFVIVVGALSCIIVKSFCWFVKRKKVAPARE